RPEARAILIRLKVKNMDVRRKSAAGNLCYELKPLQGSGNAECEMTLASSVEPQNTEVQYRIIQAAVWIKLVVFVAVMLSSLVSGIARSQEPPTGETKIRIARLIDKVGA